MAEKAVIIGLFGGLLVSAGIIWAKMPPRPEIHYRQVGQTTAGTVGASKTVDSAPETRVIPIDKPKPVELPKWTQYHPFTSERTEVMPDTQDQRNIQDQRTETRPRQVPLPKRRPVGAVNRPHCPCKKLRQRRPVFVLPQADGGTL